MLHSSRGDKNSVIIVQGSAGSCGITHSKSVNQHRVVRDAVSGSRCTRDSTVVNRGILMAVPSFRLVLVPTFWHLKAAFKAI